MAQGFMWNTGGANLVFGAGAVGRSYTPPAVGLTPTATITVDQRSITQTAGEMVVFDIDLSGTGWTLDAPSPPTTVYDRTTAYHVEWDFDDGYTFTNANLAGNLSYQKWDGTSYDATDSRYMIGRKAAHHYRAAGSYSPTCLIWEIVDGIPTGNVAAGAMASPLVVADRSTAYATYCLSNDTDHTGAPANSGTPGTVGSVLRVNGVTDIRDWYYANINGSTTPVQILLNAGDTFTINSGWVWGPTSTAVPDTILGTYGTGRATVNQSGTIQFDDDLAGAAYTKDFRMENILFQGTTDSSTYTGTVPPYNYHITLNSNDSTNVPNQISHDNCVIQGFDLPLYANPPSSSGFMLSQNDTNVNDWISNIILCYNSGKHVAVGSSFRSDPNAIRNYDTAGDDSAVYPHRGGCDLWLYSQCNWFTKQGHGGNDIHHQLLRLAGSRSPSTNSEGYITRCVLEAGYAFFRLGQENGDGVPPVPNVGYLFDSNVMVGDLTFNNVSDVINQSGFEFRNNLVVIVDTVVEEGDNGFIRIRNATPNIAEGGAGSALNLSGPFRAYNNTFVNLRTTPGSWTGPVFLDENAGGTFENVVDRNNVYYAPNSNTTDAPLDATTVLFTAVSEGKREWDAGLIANTGHNTDIHPYSIQSGSAAIDDVDMVTGGGTAYAPHTRIGSLRGSVSGSTFTPSSPDRGASEL